MKFFHLADLHIGKVVNGFSMLEDQRHVFDQVLGYVRTQRPDAVLIAGDVYDKPTPGIDAVRLFDDFLTALAGEGVTVLVIGGNHDSQERLGFGNRILHQQNIHIAGAFDGKLRKVTLADAYGEADFFLLPFVRPSMVRRFFVDGTVESYEDAIRAAIGTAEFVPGRRNVLLAHQFFVSPSMAPERSDSEIGPVGGIDSIRAGVLPPFDYVALGHLHGAQRVGSEGIRYAGSPLKYSFSECRQHKSVSLVELDEKGLASVECLPLTPLRDLRKIKGTLAQVMGDEWIAQGDPADYLHITLTDEEEILDATGKIRTVYPNYMVLAFENSRTQAIADFDGNMAVEGVDPFELFGEFFRSQNGTDLNADQAAVIQKYLRQMEEGV